MENQPKKEDRRVAYTKMFLKESLLSLLQEKPIGKITPTELCRRADINRNTFYTHYESPEALLRSIEEELYGRIRHSVEHSIAGTSSIQALLGDIFKAIVDNGELCKILFSDYGDKEYLKRIINLARDLSIAQWRAAGMKEDEESLEMLYTFSASGSIAVIQQWIQQGMKKSPQELALFIEKATYSGLLAFISKR